jgi:hypothetical protein
MIQRQPPTSVPYRGGPFNNITDGTECVLTLRDKYGDVRATRLE